MNYEIKDLRSAELEEIQKELHEIDPTFKLKPANLGLGADWILILAVLNGITTIFLLGDKIEKGIKGWISVAKRFKKIFKKSDSIYIDKDLANLLAIEYISHEYKIESIKIINESVIPISDLSGGFSDRKSGEFISHPWSVFITTFEVNERFKVILGTKSNGEIEKLYSFDSLDHHPF